MPLSNKYGLAIFISALITSCGSLFVATDSNTRTLFGDSNMNVSMGDNGEVKGVFSASSSDEQTMELSGDSGLSGTKMVFPAGSLAIDTEITMEEGDSLANSTIADELNLEDPDQVSSAGPSVVIQSSELIDASEPFTLSIPLSETTNLSLIASCENLVVIFKVMRVSEDKSLFLGVIPTSELNISEGSVSFEAKNFGAYQPACVAKRIESRIEVKTVSPIIVKRRGNALVGTWSSKCHVDDKAGDGGGDVEYLKEKIFASETEFTFRMNIHKSSDCSDRQMLSLMLKAEYKIGAEIKSGQKELDLKFTKSLITIYTKAAIGEFNKNKMCGYSDWESGVPKVYKSDLCDFGGNETNSDGTQDASDDGPPSVGESYFFSFQFVDNLLYLSNDDVNNVGETVETRAIIIDKENPFKKI